MRSFSVPVIYTTVGWIEIHAKDREEAVTQARKLNDVGIEYFSIQDPEVESVIEVGELEEIREEK